MLDAAVPGVCVHEPERAADRGGDAGRRGRRRRDPRGQELHRRRHQLPHRGRSVCCPTASRSRRCSWPTTYASESEDGPGRRGTAATVAVEKICGAAAARGDDLASVAALGGGSPRGARSMSGGLPSVHGSGRVVPVLRARRRRGRTSVSVSTESAAPARRDAHRHRDRRCAARTRGRFAGTVRRRGRRAHRQRTRRDPSARTRHRLRCRAAVSRGARHHRPTHARREPRDGVRHGGGVVDRRPLRRRDPRLWDAPTEAPAWPRSPRRTCTTNAWTTRTRQRRRSFRRRGRPVRHHLGLVVRRACSGRRSTSSPTSIAEPVTATSESTWRSVWPTFAVDESASPAAVFEILARGFLGNAGGTSGALFGAFFHGSRFALDGPGRAPRASPREWADGLAAITDLGGAQPGDKTMVTRWTRRHELWGTPDRSSSRGPRRGCRGCDARCRVHDGHRRPAWPRQLHRRRGARRHRPRCSRGLLVLRRRLSGCIGPQEASAAELPGRSPRARSDARDHAGDEADAIAVVARYDMQVRVEHGLGRRASVVHGEVDPVRRQGCCGAFAPARRLPGGEDLPPTTGFECLEPRGVHLGNHQGLCPRGDGPDVEEREHRVGLVDDRRGGAAGDDVAEHATRSSLMLRDGRRRVQAGSRPRSPARLVVGHVGDRGLVRVDLDDDGAPRCEPEREAPRRGRPRRTFPTTRTASAASTDAATAAHSASGSGSPNHTDTGADRTPAETARRRRDAFRAVLDVVERSLERLLADPSTAPRPACRGRGPARWGPGALVQVVDVLRGDLDGLLRGGPLPLREGNMTGVRARGGHELRSSAVPGPHQIGSRTNASGLASSSGEYRYTARFCASRNVGTPDAREIPAPVSTATAGRGPDGLQHGLRKRRMRVGTVGGHEASVPSRTDTLGPLWTSASHSNSTLGMSVSSCVTLRWATRRLQDLSRGRHEPPSTRSFSERRQSAAVQLRGTRTCRQSLEVQLVEDSRE